MIKSKEISSKNSNHQLSFKSSFKPQLSNLIHQSFPQQKFGFSQKSEKIAILTYYKNITQKEINFRLPPKSAIDKHKKTLILDLDETLVHSGFNMFPGHPDQIIITVSIENKIHNVYVLVRPGAEEFLEKMSKLYEVVIFTASLSKYAGPLLDKLDKKKFCSYRLFREHCTIINNGFVKDLKKLGRDMKDVIIIDNNPVSYSLNVENGFPIKSWLDDINDRELIKIIPVLEFLSKVKDVREYIKLMCDNGQFSHTKADKIINLEAVNNKNNLKNNQKEQFEEKKNNYLSEDLQNLKKMINQNENFSSTNQPNLKNIQYNNYCNENVNNNTISPIIHYNLNNYPSHALKNTNPLSQSNQIDSISTAKYSNTFRSSIGKESNLLRKTSQIPKKESPLLLNTIQASTYTANKNIRKPISNMNSPYKLSYQQTTAQYEIPHQKLTNIIESQVKQNIYLTNQNCNTQPNKAIMINIKNVNYNDENTSNNSNNENAFYYNNHLRNYSVGKINSQRHPTLNLTNSNLNNFMQNNKGKFFGLEKNNRTLTDETINKRGISTSRTFGNYYLKN